jgi:hypothetical protein
MVTEEPFGNVLVRPNSILCVPTGSGFAIRWYP